VSPPWWLSVLGVGEGWRGRSGWQLLSRVWAALCRGGVVVKGTEFQES